MKQHKVIAYLKVKVEMTLNYDEDSDKVIEDLGVDVYHGPRGLGVKYEVVDYEIYSDEQVRG